jgi:hypothetical protein
MTARRQLDPVGLLKERRRMTIPMTPVPGGGPDPGALAAPQP